jgi:hypothetical protein
MIDKILIENQESDKKESGFERTSFSGTSWKKDDGVIVGKSSFRIDYGRIHLQLVVSGSGLLSIA